MWRCESCVGSKIFQTCDLEMGSTPSSTSLIQWSNLESRPRWQQIMKTGQKYKYPETRTGYTRTPRASQSILTSQSTNNLLPPLNQQKPEFAGRCRPYLTTNYHYSQTKVKLEGKMKMAESNTVHSPLLTYFSMVSLLSLCPPFVILL